MGEGQSLKPVRFTGGNVGSGGVLISKFRGCFSNATEELEGRVTRKKCAETGREENFEEAIEIECEAESNSGETASAKISDQHVGEVPWLQAFRVGPCSNGPAEGEIQVNPLKGKLGYINKTEKKVGLLEPRAKKRRGSQNSTAPLPLRRWLASELQGRRDHKPESHGGYDGIISPITPVNTMTSE